MTNAEQIISLAAENTSTEHNKFCVFDMAQRSAPRQRQLSRGWLFTFNDQSMILWRDDNAVILTAVRVDNANEHLVDEEGNVHFIRNEWNQLTEVEAEDNNNNVENEMTNAQNNSLANNTDNGEEMTIAEKIAARFHNDGQCFEVDGVEINDVVEELRSSWWQNDEMEAAISVFKDGSMIVMQAWWDIITEYRGMLRDSNGETWAAIDEYGDLITGDSLLTAWRRRYC